MKFKSLKKHRLTRSQKLLLAAPVLAGAVIPAAQGAIIYTSLGSSGITVSGSNELYIDWQGQTTGASTFPGWDIGLSINNVSGDYYSQVSANISSVDLGAYYRTTVGLRFPINDPIVREPALYGSTFYNIPKTYLTISSASGNYFWSPSATHYYLGVQLTPSSDYGWVEIALTAFNSMTVYGFAYDNTGAAINAGAVPEPADAGLLAGVLAGSAAAYAARRKRLAAKQAA
jgi:hypothetical protein